jgi:hypothetical protein
MSSSNRRVSSTKKLVPIARKAKAPLSLDEEKALIRSRIERLEVTSASAQRWQEDDEMSAADSWRRKGTARVPHNRRVKQKKEFATVLIEVTLSSVLLLGAVIWVWKRFG